MTEVKTNFESTLWYTFTTNAMFDLFNQLDTASDVATKLTPEMYYDKVIGLIKNYYDDLPVWEIEQVLAEPKPSLLTYRDAESALKEALSKFQIRDPYTQIRSKSQMRAARKDLEAKGLVTSFLEDGICYVEIPSLVSRYTADEVEEALRANMDAAGYVLDLRGNTGGYLDQMVGVLSLVIDSAFVGISEGFLNRKFLIEQADLLSDKFAIGSMHYRVLMPRRPNLTGDKPMLVLIDNDTRSAAEMLAFLLAWEKEDSPPERRIYRRARIVSLPDTKTKGKSTLQQTVSIGRGNALRITAAQLKPAFVNIGGTGISSDLIVEPEQGEDFDSALEEIRRYLPEIVMNSLRAEIASS